MICVATDITYDFKLFQHWWKYYRSLGISNFVVAVGDFIDPSLPVKFKKAYGSVDGIKIVPISERFKKTGFEANNKEETRQRYICAKDWMIPADLDEFIQFAEPIHDLIERMKEKKCNHVTGEFVDRLSPDGQLTEIDPQKNIWEQYPLEASVSADLVKCWCRKVVLLKGDVPLIPGAHAILNKKGNDKIIDELGKNKIINELGKNKIISALKINKIINVLRKNKRLPVENRIHHFKWTSTLRSALIRRVGFLDQRKLEVSDESKRGKPEVQDESKRVLSYLNAKGRIIPEEFHARMGWKPTYSC